jgi:hypothetical protein
LGHWWWITYYIQPDLTEWCYQENCKNRIFITSSKIAISCIHQDLKNNVVCECRRSCLLLYIFSLFFLAVKYYQSCREISLIGGQTTKLFYPMYNNSAIWFPQFVKYFLLRVKYQMFFLRYCNFGISKLFE